jgi:hypothetical protein
MHWGHQERLQSETDGASTHEAAYSGVMHTRAWHVGLKQA